MDGWKEGRRGSSSEEDEEYEEDEGPEPPRRSSAARREMGEYERLLKANTLANMTVLRLPVGGMGGGGDVISARIAEQKRRQLIGDEREEGIRERDQRKHAEERTQEVVEGGGTPMRRGKGTPIRREREEEGEDKLVVEGGRSPLRDESMMQGPGWRQVAQLRRQWGSATSDSDNSDVGVCARGGGEEVEVEKKTGGEEAKKKKSWFPLRRLFASGD